jgi:hypothetical protein
MVDWEGLVFDQKIRTKRRAKMFRVASLEAIWKESGPEFVQERGSFSWCVFWWLDVSQADRPDCGRLSRTDAACFPMGLKRSPCFGAMIA